MNAHASIEANLPEVTKGQAALANGYAQELCEHTYYAMIGPEGEPSREEHIAKARAELARCARVLGCTLIEGRRG